MTRDREISVAGAPEVVPGSAPPLFERERELIELGGLLASAVGGTGAVALVEGPAGIGKTGLVRATCTIAAERGMEVALARAGEFERDFSYGIARQLFEGLVLSGAASDELLGGPAALAAPALGVDAPPEAAALGADTAFAALHGLFWLTSNLAHRGPLLLAVDDVQWSDPASLRFLSYLARRVEGLPIAVLLARRTGEESSEPGMLGEIATDPRTRRLTPLPLSSEGSALLVRERLSPVADDAVCAAAHDATGGNPFLLGTLVQALHSQDLAAGADAVAAVGELGPSAVAGWVFERLTHLGENAVVLARSTSVLGGTPDLSLAAEVAGLDAADAGVAADSLAEGTILQRTHPLDFVHPLVREAIYESISPTARSAAHAAAATALEQRRAPADQVASHLLAVDPRGEARVVELLRTAANGALAQGAPDAAASYLERALREPPSEAERPSVLRELGTASFLCGADGALECLDQAFRTATDPRERVLAAFVLSRALLTSDRLAETAEVVERALSEAGPESRDVVPGIEGILFMLAHSSPASRRLVIDRARRAFAQVEEAEDPPAPVMAHAAFERAFSASTAAEAAELAERALASGLLDQVSADDPSVWVACGTLTLANRLDEAEIWLGRALSEARGRNSARAFVVVSAFRSRNRYRRGDLALAESDARAALDLVQAHGWANVGEPLAAASLVHVLVERGRHDEAMAVVDAVDPNKYDSEMILAQPLVEALASLRMAQRRPQDALDLLAGSAAWERGCEIEGGAWAIWRALASLCHLTLGQEKEAEDLADEALTLGRQWGSAFVLGAALRAKGLVTGGAEGLGFLSEAVEVAADSPLRLEHARALVERGGARRRAGARVEARDDLKTGMDLAFRCGATELSERARQELVAAGEKPRRYALSGVDSLTPSERRVARMAADGLTNREIAQALFVTMRTVQMHLTNVYRKLDIASREALPDVMADESRREVEEEG